MLRKVVEEMRDERVAEARYLVSVNMLDDHVHLNKEGHEVWDGVLRPHVVAALRLEEE
jgi:hypothetical protein